MEKMVNTTITAIANSLLSRTKDQANVGNFINLLSGIKSEDIRPVKYTKEIWVGEYYVRIRIN
mgnify:CR=1 FL=1